MLFNSTTFVLFFAVVWLLYQPPLAWRWRKLLLLVASYVFYAAWSPPFVLLLWISTGVDWFVGRALGRATGRGARRALLGISLGVNLGMLGYFKYGGFLLDNLTLALRGLGVAYQPPGADIVLPVGISFYTFQTLSYTIEVHQGRERPWGSFLDFALYVTFFPQLVAGPIVRAHDFLPQCLQPRAPCGRTLGWGLTLFVVGLFEKTVLADVWLAPHAERLFDAAQAPDGASAWLGALAFAGQIYGDFAGYSTCAIGVAMCLGFALPDNFHAPYAALGFSDFWRRWHISLSTWLRDYVYIGLGGNRGGWSATQRNLMITMVLGGLWHGASWTFVVWGALHGLLLILERILRRALPPSPLWSSPVVRLYGILLTFVAVVSTWVFFRAPSLSRAVEIVAAMVGLRSGVALLDAADQLVILTITAAMVGGHLWMRERTLEEVFSSLRPSVRIAVLSGLLVAVLSTPGVDRAFLYFQF
ncbi:MAG TPA: MBOAT family protein [Deltaproteobacteria bacterium]|nr:MBOAT family protein [Deltaproteobacteria bacterium]